MEFDWEHLLRVFIGGLCGALIGYERKSRMKEAGIRTHFVVGVGASLMMVVSKYGFGDLQGISGYNIDPTKIASEVVSGVGFIGAGMIFTQKNMIKGLTTAAGIWTTAGIGLAVGAGMYIVGTGITLFMLVAQIILHSRFYRIASPATEHLLLRVDSKEGSLGEIKEVLRRSNVIINGLRTERGKDEGELVIHMAVKLPGSGGADELLSVIGELPHVKSLETVY